MSAFKIQDWGDGDGTAFVILDDELVPATEAAIAEVAHSAMLLSQGAERAIEMYRERRESAPDSL